MRSTRLFTDLRPSRRRRRFSEVVRDERGVGFRFLATGHVVYLLGNPEDRLPINAAEPDQDGDVLGDADLRPSRTLHDLMPGRNLLGLRLHEGFHLVFEAARHVGLLNRRERRA